MSEASSFPVCPQCRQPVPAGAAEGLCPRCLLAGAATPSEPAPPGFNRPEPPPLPAVRAAFPELEISGLIGVGGMSFVYRARQPKLDRTVALKLLPVPPGADPAFAERFHREARFLARLSHPNIVTVHDFGQTGGFCHLLLEFVDGVNLRQAMQAGRFTPAQALALVPRICEALQYSTRAAG
jgi:serine/threonine protein kinase